MRKTFILDELDCANCGAKMEDLIRKIDGVKDVKISFIMQKITLEADDEIFDDVLKNAVKVCRRIEPDCHIKI